MATWSSTTTTTRRTSTASCASASSTATWDPSSGSPRLRGSRSNARNDVAGIAGKQMARILITGSADGLGRAAAQSLLGDGHEVIVHARSAERLAAVSDLVDRGASAVAGDLADVEQVRATADRVNRLGPLDAVIHNAGVLGGPHVLLVNVVAPYLLTALSQRPQRLV